MPHAPRFLVVVTFLLLALGWSLPSTPSSGDGAASDVRERGMLLLDETAPLLPGGTVDVDIREGDVVFEAGQAGQVRLQIFVDALDAELGRARFEKMSFGIATRGTRVEVVGKEGQGARDDSTDRGWVRVVAVIRHPPEAQVSLRTHDGEAQPQRKADFR